MSGGCPAPADLGADASLLATNFDRLPARLQPFPALSAISLETTIGTRSSVETEQLWQRPAVRGISNTRRTPIPSPPIVSSSTTSFLMIPCLTKEAVHGI